MCGGAPISGVRRDRGWACRFLIKRAPSHLSSMTLGAHFVIPPVSPHPSPQLPSLPPSLPSSPPPSPHTSGSTSGSPAVAWAALSATILGLPPSSSLSGGSSSGGADIPQQPYSSSIAPEPYSSSGAPEPASPRASQMLVGGGAEAESPGFSFGTPQMKK